MPKFSPASIIETDPEGRVVISAVEAAHSLNMSRTSFWRARRLGEIQTVRLGPRRIGVTVAERNRFLRARSAA